MAVLFGLVLAFIGGAAAGRALLGTPRDEPANFFLVLMGVLGVQTTLLLIWIAVMLFGRQAAGSMLALSSIGGFIVQGGQRLAAAIHRGMMPRAALMAHGRMILDPAIARGTFSAISHGLWLAFNCGCLLMIIVLLSARQYTFAWETTILNADSYVPLTRAVAALPRLAGFAAPSNEQIVAAQWRGSDEAFTQDRDDSRAWSAFLVGCLVMYGFAPRLLLMAWSIGQRRSALSRYRLDLTRPEFLRLEATLMPVAAPLGVRDGDDAAEPSPFRPADLSDSAPIAKVGTGLPAILGFEIERPSVWPPQLHGMTWTDLGIVETRDQQHAIIHELQNGNSPPRSIVLVGGLTSVPDRGVERFVTQVQRTTKSPLFLLLTGGQSLRQRADLNGLEQRIADWRALASRVGIAMERVLELDLDHLTDESRSRLAQVTGRDSSAGDSAVTRETRRLEASFKLVSDWWRSHDGSKPPDADDAVRLHQSIMGLHSEEAGSWRSWLRVPGQLSGTSAHEIASTLSQGSRRFMDMLPLTLRNSPKWLAAGAMAGALGCVAAAALLSPVAIGALPLWSAIGAAVSGVLHAHRSQAAVSSPPSETSLTERDQIVRSAVLLAMMLELQGRGEALITRVLQDAVDPVEAALPFEISAFQEWLDEQRHRFDQALAREIQTGGGTS